MANDTAVTVCRTTDVAPNTMRGMKRDSNDYLVVNDNGTFRVYQNKCPHRGARLSAGKLEAGVLTCPWHHSRFDIHSGKLLSGPEIGPAVPFIRKMIAAFVRGLREYPVEIRGDSVVVVQT